MLGFEERKNRFESVKVAAVWSSRSQMKKSQKSQIEKWEKSEIEKTSLVYRPKRQIIERNVSDQNFDPSWTVHGRHGYFVHLFRAVGPPVSDQGRLYLSHQGHPQHLEIVHRHPFWGRMSCLWRSVWLLHNFIRFSNTSSPSISANFIQPNF